MQYRAVTPLNGAFTKKLMTEFAHDARFNTPVSAPTKMNREPRFAAAE
jgi:hypothetical protein